MVTLLRFQNPDGSSKDWSVEVMSDGTVIRRWGKTGKKMQESITPPAKTGPDPNKFAQDLIQSKLNKGYKPVEITPELEAAAKAAERQALAKKADESMSALTGQKMPGFNLF
jgi:predicted DNA-binding WGR domain protein